MPLRTIINQSTLVPEDADLLESLFNQFSLPNEDADRRRERASGLVTMFVDGERDRARLIAYLTGAEPPRHSMSSASPG